MKIFKLVGMALLAIVMSANLTSCGGDEQETLDWEAMEAARDRKLLEITPLLLGTWETEFYHNPYYREYIRYTLMDDKAVVKYYKSIRRIAINGEMKPWQPYEEKEIVGTWEPYLGVVEDYEEASDYVSFGFNTFFPDDLGDSYTINLAEFLENKTSFTCGKLYTKSNNGPSF